jgi:hypothetical protein
MSSGSSIEVTLSGFWPMFWLVAIALRWRFGWDAAGPMIFWVPGIALLETNAILIALRARRGLTLTQRGITWHKYEMYLPWSNVVAVEQRVLRRGARLVVRVDEPAQALEDVARPARLVRDGAARRRLSDAAAGARHRPTRPGTTRSTCTPATRWPARGPGCGTRRCSCAPSTGCSVRSRPVPGPGADRRPDAGTQHRRHQPLHDPARGAAAIAGTL